MNNSNVKIYQENNNFYLYMDENILENIYRKLKLSINSIFKILIDNKVDDNLFIIIEKSDIFVIINVLKENNLNIEIDDFIKYIINKDLNKVMNISKNEYENSNEFKEYKNFLNNNIKRQLKDHQIFNSFFHYKLEQSANFSSPGSGKTSTVLSTYAYLKKMKDIKFLIIIGTKSSLISWKDEFIACFNKDNPKIFTKKNFLDKSLKDFPNIVKEIIKNYDFIFLTYKDIQKMDSTNNKKQNYKIINYILEDNNGYLVIDESHNIKNENSKSFINSFDLLKNIKYKTLLSGTPIPNGIQDIYTQLKMLHHFWYDTFWKYTQRDLRNLNYYEKDEFKNKLNYFYVRTTKSKLNIPVQNPDKIIKYDLTEEEDKVYNQILKENSKSNFLLFIRLLQSLIDPSLLKKSILSEIDFEESEEIDFEEDENFTKNQLSKMNNENINISFNQISSTKMSKVIALIKELTHKKLNVIVWSTFVSPMHKLRDELKKENIRSYIIKGDVSVEEREKFLSEFKNDHGSVLITNPQTLSESISLHKSCHHAIYLDFSYNLVHFLQSKDRIHRLGITNNEIPTYYYFISNKKYGNIEEKIWRAIQNKKKLMDEIINSDYIESFDNKFSTLKFVEEIIRDIKNEQQ